MTKKVDYQKLEKRLVKQNKSCWEIWNEKIRKDAFTFAEDYKKFLDKVKTEREAVKEAIKVVSKKGFKNITEISKLKPGDKVYFSQRGKSLIMAKLGTENLTNGFRMVMSHIDSPHLDLKVSPLYEDESLAFFKTQYYGGIKKYQWPTVALALHGVAYLENGKEVEFTIGEKKDEPIFMITDLLPHLEKGETKKREVKGEDLNLLVGSIPVNEKKIKEKVKLAILEYLFNEFGIKEDDFSSADIQAVPSEKARDLGFDRSLISAYGHDDRICSYAALNGFLDSKDSRYSQICILIDKEEIGSEGNTSAQSLFIENFISQLLELTGEDGKISNVYKTFSNSNAISSDVTAAVDPDYKDVHDLRSAPRLGFGFAIEKYVGYGGKYSTSEAPAEFIQELKAIFKKNKNITYQITGGLGKVDQGGGGTIAKYMANRNIEIVDMGVPLFNMHAPLEIASKADLYCTYLAYKEFLQN